MRRRRRMLRALRKVISSILGGMRGFGMGMMAAIWPVTDQRRLRTSTRPCRWLPMLSSSTYCARYLQRPPKAALQTAKDRRVLFEHLRGFAPPPPHYAPPQISSMIPHPVRSTLPKASSPAILADTDLDDAYPTDKHHTCEGTLR